MMNLMKKTFNGRRGGCLLARCKLIILIEHGNGKAAGENCTEGLVLEFLPIGGSIERQPYPTNKANKLFNACAKMG